MMCNCLLCHLSHRSSILFLLSENRNKSDKQTCFGWRENLTSQVRKMLERFCNSEEGEREETSFKVSYRTASTFNLATKTEDFEFIISQIIKEVQAQISCLRCLLCRFKIETHSKASPS